MATPRKNKKWPPIRDVARSRASGANHAIYMLVDVGTRLPMYIGKSCEPRSRYVEHLRLSGDRTYPVNRWAKDAAERGEPPEMVILEWVTDWEEAERRWIAGIKAEGYVLLNVSNGGLEMKHVTRANRKFPIYTWALRHCGAKNGNHFKRPAYPEAMDALRQAAKRAREAAGDEGMLELEQHLLAGLYDVAPFKAFELDIRSWER